VTGWLSWEYMHNKLDMRMSLKCTDGEITEEEYESYSDRIQLFDMDEMKEEFDSIFREKDIDELL